MEIFIFIKISLIKKLQEFGLVLTKSFFWLGKEYFPEVTFENSPREVEIKLVK
jgi:hypothetical protein